MAFFRDDFERGVNFTASTTSAFTGAEADRMIARAQFDGFTHGFLVITIAGTLTGLEVGVGPMNVGGPAPSPSTPNTNYGNFTYGRSDLTASDQAVRIWLQTAQNRGFKLRLRPWIYPSAWRGSMNPGGTDPRDRDAFHTFMGNLRESVKHYAHIAAEFAPVDGFSIGSEYIRLMGDDLYPPSPGYLTPTQEWSQIAAEVRAIVGPDALLSYGAEEFGGTGRDEEWDLYSGLFADPNIDYIGIDAYMSLAKLNERADDGKYISARHVNGRLRYGVPLNLYGVANGAPYWTVFKNLSILHGKPIIFEEYGFAARRGASDDSISQPIIGVYSNSGLDYNIMNEAHKGWLEAMHDQDWCAGAYVWEMNRLNSGLVVDNGLGDALSAPDTNASQNVIGKPVEAIYRALYDPDSIYPPTPSARPSRRFR